MSGEKELVHKCVVCGVSLVGRRFGARTCGTRCRVQEHRRQKKETSQARKAKKTR